MDSPNLARDAGGATEIALNQRFRSSLVRYFSRRFRDASEIEDMVQEVFVRLLRRGEIENVEQLGGYVFQTAQSVVTDRFRRRRSHCVDNHEEFNGQDHGIVDFTPERVLESKQNLRRAITILLELPERTRIVFVLRRLEDMKYSEIATRLGISVSAVEKHMQRAVAHLSIRLGNE